MKFMVSIQYDGTHYKGWQRLKDQKSIQETIEKFLSKELKETILIKGASRTDKGVHAMDQRFIFETSRQIDEKKVKLILRGLPKDIHVNFVTKNPNVHIRYDVKRKYYEYKIRNNYNVFKRNYIYYQKEKINIKALKEAALLFQGLRDYKSFTIDPDDTMRNIKVKVIKRSNGANIILSSKGFKRYMCRKIVGSMIDFSNQKISLENIKNMIDNPALNSYKNKAPANALYLKKIKY
ncbi:MAG: hypothetical protein NC236_01665 [Mycoplasma sp.]|nr:hypothetical protein [Mycoplasma sp.]